MTEAQSPAVRKCSECDKMFQDWRKLGHCDDCDRKMLRERKFDETLKANFGVSIFGEEEDMKGIPLSNHYQYKAKKTRYCDQWNGSVLYDSMAEARCARILDRDGIQFTPHVKFKCFDRDGKPFDYTIDFVFSQAQDLAGISKWITVLEFKGVLTKKDLLRLAALQYCHQVKGYIVTDALLNLWEREGTSK